MNKTIMFETDRLILRRFEENDYNHMFKNYCSDAEVAKYVTWQAHKSIEETKTYLLNVVLPKYEEDEPMQWAIVLKETGEVIGSIDIVKQSQKLKCAELGWVLSKKYWGQGLMPEAATVIRDYLFSLGFVRIDAVHNVENPKSGRVMQKIGMIHEGTLHKHSLNNNGELVDVELYAITK